MKKLFNKLNRSGPAKKTLTFGQLGYIDAQADHLVAYLISSPSAIVETANEKRLLDVIAGEHGVDILYRAIKRSAPYDGVDRIALATAVVIKHKRFDLADKLIAEMKSLCSGYRGRNWYIRDSAQTNYGRALFLHICNEDPCLEQMKTWIKKSPFKYDIEAAIFLSAYGRYATVAPFMREIGAMSLDEFARKLPAFMGDDEYGQQMAVSQQQSIKAYLAGLKSGTASSGGAKPTK